MENKDKQSFTSPPEVKLHFLDYWRIIRIRKTVILAVFLLVVITATLVTFILPESFSSTARIKIERDQSDITGMAERPWAGSYDPYFIQTEFEVIQSELILGKVVKDLDLNKEWGKKFANGEKLKDTETIQLLKSRMDLRPVRNTSLIEIRVYSDRPEEAARLANAVAKAYKDHRLNQRRQLSRGGIEALEERFKKHEKEIEEAQKLVNELSEKLQIPDAVVNFDSPAVLITAETLRKVESQRIESKTDLVKQETMLNELKKLSAQELEQALPTTVQDPQMNSLLETRTMAEQSLVIKTNQFGPENEEIQKLKSQISDLNV